MSIPGESITQFIKDSSLQQFEDNQSVNNQANQKEVRETIQISQFDIREFSESNQSSISKPELNQSSINSLADLKEKIASLKTKLENLTTLSQAKEKAMESTGSNKERIENIEKAAEKMSSAQKAGRLAKIFGWIATAATAVIGGLMIATGAGAVVGGLMLAGVALKIGMEVAQHFPKAKEWMEAHPAFGYAMLGAQIMLALTAPITGFVTGLVTGATAGVGAIVLSAVDITKKISEVGEKIMDKTKTSKMEQQIKENEQKIQPESNQEKVSIEQQIQQMMQELVTGMGAIQNYAQMLSQVEQKFVEQKYMDPQFQVEQKFMEQKPTGLQFIEQNI